MKLITVEEHTVHTGVAAASAERLRTVSPGFAAAYDAASGLDFAPSVEVLQDLGEARLADMDANGIDVQVISNLTTQLLPHDVATGLVREVNDRLATAVAQHPDRFAAFASVPTTAPEDAADELRRAVGELGHVGALIHGRTEDDFLSEERFAPLLKAAEDLAVPLYLHPGAIPRAASVVDYEGHLDPVVATRFATTGWGWHDETGLHFLQLVLAGVFDRHPDLQFILGHWGEMIPWSLDRLDEALPSRLTGLEREVSEYVRQNSYYTPSGMFTPQHLDFCVRTLGVDRMLYSVDYPFVGNEGAREFLEGSGLSGPEKEAVAHGNAERLLKI